MPDHPQAPPTTGPLPKPTPAPVQPSLREALLAELAQPERTLGLPPDAPWPASTTP